MSPEMTDRVVCLSIIPPSSCLLLVSDAAVQAADGKVSLRPDWGCKCPYQLFRMACSVLPE